MKKNSLKGMKKRIVPLCYQKKSLSRSNTSLSQLLSFASYKKRINELVRNNRSLAVALQESRCETAYQNTILKDYARDLNQITFARLKLQGMAKSIAKLVTDLHEVVECLNVNWASSNHNLLQKTGHPPDRMKIKVPSFDCIQEVSLLSSENGKSAESSVPEPTSTSNEISSEKSSHNREDIIDIQPRASECDEILANDLDVPPVLFVDDVGGSDEPIERHSRKSKSSRKSTVINQTSLTPELDIDFSCTMSKRSSSRRRTQFIPSAPSSSKICDLDLALPAEYTTPKKSVLPSKSIVLRKLSSALINCEQNLDDNDNPESAFVNMKERGSKKASSSPPDSHFEQYSEKSNNPECTFVNMKDRGSKNADISSPDFRYTSMHINGHDVNLGNPSSVPLTAVSKNENIESNCTVLFSEDMELTDVIHPVAQIISEKFPSSVRSPVGNSDVQLGELRTNEEVNYSVEKMCYENELLKLTKKSECVEVLSKDMNSNKMDSKSYGSITTNAANTFMNNEATQCTESTSKEHSISPLHRRSTRNRKNMIYKVFLSSSESESDTTPIKSQVNIKKHKTQRDTVIFKPEINKRTSNANNKLERAEKSPLKEQLENKELQNALSIYDLDVSNSKNPTKKSRPKPKAKNSSPNKKLSKPLSKNCCITKLKGITYKFSKKENSLDEVKGNQQLPKANCLSEINPTVSTNKMVKGMSNLSCNNVKGNADTGIKNRESVNPIGDEISTSGIADYGLHEISFKSPKSESKKVSFASTDLVCNFTKMSVSKTIAGNRKIRRASKSVFELEDTSNQQSSEKTPTVEFETNESAGGIDKIPEISSEELFNLSEKTELYTFVIPSGTHQTATKTDECSSLKTNVSSAGVPSNFCDHYGDLSSKKSQLNVKQKLGKLSLKGNKMCKKKIQVDSFDEIDKDVLTVPLHSDSPVLKSKYKHSHKELSLNDLKENMVPINSQTLDISQTEIQNKSKISEQSQILPVDIISESIKRVAKSSQKRDVLSQKHELPQPALHKTSKKSSHDRKFTEFSPVLKDVQNLEGKAENRDSAKRRSKLVNYKEPPLNKKMRRG